MLLKPDVIQEHLSDDTTTHFKEVQGTVGILKSFVLNTFINMRAGWVLFKFHIIDFSMQKFPHSKMIRRSLVSSINMLWKNKGKKLRLATGFIWFGKNVGGRITRSCHKMHNCHDLQQWQAPFPWSRSTPLVLLSMLRSYSCKFCLVQPDCLKKFHCRNVLWFSAPTTRIKQISRLENGIS